MKYVAAMLLALTLVGCSAPPAVVPVVEKTKITELLARPPADPMKPPVEPIPLRKGGTMAENSEIMRKNNLNALDDRTKLRILQQYIKNIFSDAK